ncbi:glycoside hydrolase family 42 [Wenyingzhuangia aestuarii]|uniref:glycoside hydrolase family 42 n=1 Tax=Wenyingzhuangia aestuarii TaxID=1647582 RepID=UPI00143A3BD8|nr:glycoside hydrolase family 42 [Wenyingzhuangia aestuarii]NJB83142.1 beta-galactosidase [Wenyingzhuangia aestuarii]
MIRINKPYLLVMLLFVQFFSVNAQELNKQAKKKITQLEKLMTKAQKKGFDVTREETIVWFSKEFLKIAKWDENHTDFIQESFEKFTPIKGDKAQMAKELPEFERTKVIEILDQGIDNLTKVVKETIVRRPVRKVDWERIKVENDQFTSNGKPIFLYDYFSKSMGNPTSDPSIYNDHLGNIDHIGGFASSSLKEDRTFNAYALNKAIHHPNTKAGYLLLWNTNVPKWIKEQEPEVTKGRSTFVGFDIDNPLMRDVWSDIIKKAGEITKGKKTVQLGYILANEPHWFSEKGSWAYKLGEMNDLSSYTLKKYKHWLSVKYKNNITKLNQNWNTNFKSFDDVAFEFPLRKETKGTPLRYDWDRFNMDRAIEWFAFLQTELHKTNPNGDTHIKLQPHFFSDDDRSHGIDIESLTELTTMIGDDAKTREKDMRYNRTEPWEKHYSYHWEELCVSYDFMESVAPEKIHVNSETHFLSSVAWRKLDTSPEYIRNNFWLATLFGMDAGLSWFWARDPDGSPEARFENNVHSSDNALQKSFAASVNMQPQVANELTQVMMDLNSFSEEIMALRRQRRPIRLFHSETSAINKKHHMSEQYPLYESLFFEGFPVGYATEKIIKKQNHKNWDVVLVYKTPYVTDSEFDELQKYLDNGGTVILDNKTSLSMDEYGHKRSQTLKNNKGKLHVLNTNKHQDLKTLALQLVDTKLPKVVLSESNELAQKGCVWRVAPNGKGGYMMTIVNLGKNKAQLKVSMKNGDTVKCTNMLTRESLGTNFELGVHGVLLLEIEK